MQLSSRILTALAVLILAVAVVAVRAGSPGTVEAATGTIDVLNVGTCYATDDEVFDADDCVSGEVDDVTGNPVDYDVAGRDEVGEVATVYATYAHDPKTAPDSPRAVLTNSNLIKISISDSGRDKRTPVLLPVGNAATANTGAACPDSPLTDACKFDNPDDPETEEIDESGYLQVIQKTHSEVTDIASTQMSWQAGSATARATDEFEITAPAVETVLAIIKDSGATEDFLPMDTGDDSSVTFWGIIRNAADDSITTPFGQLKTLTLDEDVGSGGTGADGEEALEAAPWLTIHQSLAPDKEIVLMYIVYNTSEWETLIGGNTIAKYAEGDDPGDPGDLADPFAPDFSKSEQNDTDTQLVVEARSDGRDGRQFLRLRETSRFSGRYEGYLRLTDENGGGGDDGWGLNVDAASGTDVDDAAVIGVESGPVVIAYKDTDGSIQMLDIEIDTVPPAINIESPAHESEGQDTSPEFSGTFSDSDSGLREDTFHLYVDHTDDANESGDNDGGTYALDNLGISSADLDGPTDGSLVESQEDYTGYTPDGGSQYAVYDHTDVFKTEAQAEVQNKKLVEGDNFDDGDSAGTFGDSVRIDFDLGEDIERYNHTIDFQAVVADLAGNLGFSDSDPDGPGFINDLGEEEPKTGRYNVIGWYARHIFFLDETNPVIFEEQSVTGFYGENDDDEPQPNRSGILIAFDKAVDADSIGVDTFSVTLDEAGSDQVGIIDVEVDGRAVYLLLDSELASDAQPYVDVADGEWVSDPAGNRLTGGAQEPFETNDGISPVLTVTLSGGSGTGEGSEGPAGLTKDAITASITSDEEINSTPSLVVVCSIIEWNSDGGEENDKELDDVTAQRSGSLSISSASFVGTEEAPNLYGDEYSCGDKSVSMQQLQAYSRPGLTWEYEWVNLTGGNRDLPNGNVTVVAFARDRHSYASLDTKRIGTNLAQADTYNWGAATVEFRYDTKIDDPMPTPENGAIVTESRPFVLLEFEDEVTVTIDEFEIDGTVEEISSIGGNRFLYWPESLGIGTHEVSVDATDAAGNEDTFDYSFEVAEREAFNLKLIAGWNAVSFPANPIDNAIGSVFTEGVIDMVAGWDASDPEKPWSIATRMEDEWSTHEEFATLNKIHAQYGYWVHAQGFVTQRVALIGGINRTDPEITPPDLVTIPTLAGWNFVGVIDQDGDQTQGNFGEPLANGVDEDGDHIIVEAGDYLGSNKRAYTWDPVRSKFDILEDGDELEVGQGIWVYYGGGIAP